MSWLRQRARPERQPHPDGRIETELQRILSLRAAVARQEALARTYHDEVKNAHAALSGSASKFRENYNFYAGDLAAADAAAHKRAEAAQAQIVAAESHIASLHEEISKRTSELTRSDLAYL